MRHLNKSGTRMLALAMLLCFGLVACSESEQVLQSLEPIAFHDDDECHVCGMVISDFPGPKGQAVEQDRVRKFCSAAEMLGWWLQPENQRLSAKLYVHDMSRSDWHHPDGDHLIDATTAYYVAGTQLKGAMGVVLATFPDERSAQQLADERGGEVLRFEEIDQAFLQRATAMEHGHASY